MQWNEHRKQWQQSSDGSAEKIAAKPPALVTRLRRQILRRDLLESAIAFLMLPFFVLFSWKAVAHQKWILLAFLLFLIGAIVYVPWRLWQERRKLPKADPQTSIRDYLEAERAAMLAQAKLLEGIWWWYLGPLGVGVVGVYVSIRGLVWQSLAYAVAVLVVYLMIGKGNAVAARSQFRVAVSQIEDDIAQLVVDEPRELA